MYRRVLILLPLLQKSHQEPIINNGGDVTDVNEHNALKRIINCVFSIQKFDFLVLGLGIAALSFAVFTAVKYVWKHKLNGYKPHYQKYMKAACIYLIALRIVYKRIPFFKDNISLYKFALFAFVGMCLNFEQIFSNTYLLSTPLNVKKPQDRNKIKEASYEETISAKIISVVACTLLVLLFPTPSFCLNPITYIYSGSLLLYVAFELQLLLYF